MKRIPRREFSAISKIGAVPNFLSSAPLFSLPLVFPELSATDTLEKLRQYLKDPTQLLTGPRSTGSRADAVGKWKQSCQQEGQSVEQGFPKRDAKVEFYAWDHVLDEEITAHIELTWSYDQCNIYDADAKLTVQRNDEPNDGGVFLLESYTIPEPEPEEQRPCHPCTPKCLRVVLTVVIYGAGIGSVPGIARQLNIDVTICATASATPQFSDKNTNYEQNQGTTGDNPRGPGSDPIPPPVPPHPTNGNTWGITRIDPSGPSNDKKYFPRK